MLRVAIDFFFWQIWTLSFLAINVQATHSLPVSGVKEGKMTEQPSSDGRLARDQSRDHRPGFTCVSSSTQLANISGYDGEGMENID